MSAQSTSFAGVPVKTYPVDHRVQSFQFYTDPPLWATTHRGGATIWNDSGPVFTAATPLPYDSPLHREGKGLWVGHRLFDPVGATWQDDASLYSQLEPYFYGLPFEIAYGAYLPATGKLFLLAAYTGPHRDGRPAPEVEPDRFQAFLADPGNRNALEPIWRSNDDLGTVLNASDSVVVTTNDSLFQFDAHGQGGQEHALVAHDLAFLAPGYATWDNSQLRFFNAEFVQAGVYHPAGAIRQVAGRAGWVAAVVGDHQVHIIGRNASGSGPQILEMEGIVQAVGISPGGRLFVAEADRISVYALP